RGGRRASGARDALDDVDADSAGIQNREVPVSPRLLAQGDLKRNPQSPDAVVLRLDIVHVEGDPCTLAAPGSPEYGCLELEVGFHEPELAVPQLQQHEPVVVTFVQHGTFKDRGV